MYAKLRYILAIIVSLSLTLSGCSETEYKKYEPEEELTLYVHVPYTPDFSYGSTIQQFIQQYVIPFELENPKIRVDVLTGEYEGEKVPDVYISILNFDEKIRNEDLLPLDLIMREDQFDYAQVSQAAAVAEPMLREISPDGQLYGLAGAVRTYGLIYNIDLFQQYGVPFPEDKMTWEEVMELASRFPSFTDSGERLYGLVMITSPTMKLFGPMAWIADTLQLDEIDMTSGKVHINTPEWKKIWEIVIPLLKNGNLPIEETKLEIQLFQEGRAAMWYTNVEMANAINRMDLPPINWGAVTHPINAEEPRGDYVIGDIAGISSKVKDKRAAWSFLRFYIERRMQQDEVDGRSIKSLYTLEPLRKVSSEGPFISFAAYDAFVEVVQGQIREVMAGNKTIDEALEYAQIEGQKAVDAQIQLDKYMEKMQEEPS